MTSAARPGPDASHGSRPQPPPVRGTRLPTSAEASAAPIHPSTAGDDFASERYLRGPVHAPSRGWRRVLFWLSGGRLDFKPSKAELQERSLVATVKNPVDGCRCIAVISRKGGVGKTTTTLMLGHTYANYRGDRVVALDGNPDAGSLAYRVRRQTSATITDLLRDADQITKYTDVRAYTSQAPTRLEVIASDNDPRITTRLGEQHFRKAISLLEHHYNIAVLDTGTGVLDSATQGILRLADQIVVVMEPSLDSTRAAGSTLDWLERNGYEDLVRGAVAVINAVRPQEPVQLDKVRAYFRHRCHAVVQVPWDPHLGAGAETAVERLRPGTRRAYLELAAAVAKGFQASTTPPAPSPTGSVSQSQSPLGGSIDT